MVILLMQLCDFTLTYLFIYSYKKFFENLSDKMSKFETNESSPLKFGF